jgi:hypothetical protein
MRGMEGVRYLTDESGKRVAVQLDLEIYGELLEDFFDVLTAEDRQDEETITLDELRKQLLEQGKLSEPVRS